MAALSSRNRPPIKRGIYGAHYKTDSQRKSEQSKGLRGPCVCVPFFIFRRNNVVAIGDSQDRFMADKSYRMMALQVSNAKASFRYDIGNVRSRVFFFMFVEASGSFGSVFARERLRKNLFRSDGLPIMFRSLFYVMFGRCDSFEIGTFPNVWKCNFLFVIFERWKFDRFVGRFFFFDVIFVCFWYISGNLMN